MIGEFNSDRQEVWYLETSTLTVAIHVGVSLLLDRSLGLSQIDL
ncbi:MULTISPECIES: hypothetical protein [unclassified Chamaesiphon]|nr:MULTISPECIES: hypothetical protein [unclassified Chamaesiphon]